MVRLALGGCLAQGGDFIACGFHQILHIGSGDHEARAQLHQFGNVLDIGPDPADAEMLAVRLAGFAVAS